MLLLLTASALASSLTPGDSLDQAIGVHLTDAGLAQLGDVVEALLPPEIPLTNVSGELACDSDDAAPLAYTLADMSLTIQAQDVAIETSEGRLDVWMFITFGSSSSTLDISGDCTFLTGLEETCNVQMPVTAATVHVGMELGLLEGSIQASVDAVEFELSPIGNPLDDCILSDAIGTLLNQNNNALSDLILSLVLPELDGLAGDIESTLNEGFAALALDTEIGFGDGSVRLELYPTSLNLADNGLFIGLGTTMTPSDLADCVGEIPDFEPMGSGWPAIGPEAWSTGLPYDIGLLLGRDFVDYTLWNLWAAGVLCLNIDEIEGAPVNTDLMSIFLGEAMAPLFPERSDAELTAFMPAPPKVAFYEDDPVLGIAIEAMHLELAAVLDHRWTRLFQATMQGEIGIDPGLSSAAIAPVVDLPDELLEMEESYSELLETGYAEAMNELMGVLLSTNLLPLDALPVIPLPDLLGAKVDSVFWLISDDSLWHGGFVILDTASVEAIQAPGCSGETSLGCDGGSADIDVFSMLGCEGEDLLGCEDSSSGCEDGETGCEDTGCSTHGGRLQLPFGRWFLLGVTALIFRARRRP